MDGGCEKCGLTSGKAAQRVPVDRQVEFAFRATDRHGGPAVLLGAVPQEPQGIRVSERLPIDGDDGISITKTERVQCVTLADAQLRGRVLRPNVGVYQPRR